MKSTDYFSPDYATARERFLAAARHRGAQHESHILAAHGPAGEPLTMDAARLGDPAAEHAVIISSGLHGIEGFLGSALQAAWLDNHGGTRVLPAGVSLVLVHALNPFGFAWQRRTNENNVDLNRNFLDEFGFRETDPTYRESRMAYDRFCPLLNPQSPPSRWEPYRPFVALYILREGYATRRRLRARGQPVPLPWAWPAIWRLGLRELQKTLPVGQYEHPAGLFYGGREPEETVRSVRAQLPHWVANARRVIHVDLHTGLGQYADYRLYTSETQGSEQQRWLAQCFGAQAVAVWDPQIDNYPARGLMSVDLRSRLRACRYHGLTAEFGTYAGVRVVGALRAENRAHCHSLPGSPPYRWAKSQLMEAFCPTDAKWREAAIRNGLAVIDRALAAFG